MKKVCFVAIIILAFQNVNAQTRFGLKLGANSAKWTEKINGNKDDELKSRIGFHAGLVLDHSVSQSFSIQPQLMYINKGSAIEHEDHTDNAVINAIDIPVNFLYKTKAGTGRFYVGGGPNFGFNLSGTLKSDEEDNEKIEIGSEPGQLKVFDFGINLLAGFELASGLFFSANYTPGIANLGNAAPAIDFTRKSTYLGLSVGYFFKGKK